MTEKGQLLYGVEFPAGSGVLHYDFEMRLPTVGDNIAAIEDQGVGSNMRLNAAMLARSLVALGSIPAEEISYTLLAQHMVDDDFDVLAAARDQLKKKRMRPKSGLPDSALPSSLLASTASPSSVSAN